MNRWWRTPGALLAALVLTLGSLACGRAGQEEGSDTNAGAPRSATENAINARPRDQIQDGGRLTWPISSMPVTFNYNYIDGTEADHVACREAE